MSCGRIETADLAFDYYSKKRFCTGDGVTQPSQKRYVYYFEKMLKEKLYFPYALSIKDISISKIPFENSKSFRPYIEIYLNNGSNCSFTSKLDFSDQKKIFSNNAPSISVTNQDFAYNFCGDITIKLFHHKRLSVKKIARTAFNTAFFGDTQEVLIFKLNEIDPDNLAKKGYPLDFEIQIKLARLCNCSNKVLPKVLPVCEVCSKYNSKEANDWNTIHNILDNHKTNPEQASILLFGNEDDDVMAILRAPSIDLGIGEEETKKSPKKNKKKGKKSKDELNNSFEGDCKIF